MLDDSDELRWLSDTLGDMERTLTLIGMMLDRYTTSVAGATLARPVAIDEDRRARNLQETEEWRRTPIERREALLLEALGEDALTRVDIAGRMNERLGFETFELYVTGIVSLLAKMTARGQLDAEKEPFHGAYRWRYTRSRRMTGPIVELERQLTRDDHDDDREAA